MEASTMGQMASRTGFSDEKKGAYQAKEKGTTIKEGEVIVFAKAMSEEDPLPFGVGKVLEARGEKILRFQWMGNATFNPRGTFLPGWIDNRDKKFYFQLRPRGKTHTEYLGEHDAVSVSQSEIITHGFRLLTDTNRLSASARTAICGSSEVEEAYKRDATHLFLPRSVDLQ
jgi:hypothetical protein